MDFTKERQKIAKYIIFILKCYNYKIKEGEYSFSFINPDRPDFSIHKEDFSIYMNDEEVYLGFWNNFKIKRIMLSKIRANRKALALEEAEKNISKLKGILNI